jgi:hypothetical protein
MVIALRMYVCVYACKYVGGASMMVAQESVMIPPNACIHVCIYLYTETHLRTCMPRLQLQACMPLEAVIYPPLYTATHT